MLRDCLWQVTILVGVASGDVWVDWFFILVGEYIGPGGFMDDMREDYAVWIGRR
jgi:hypothetical protein